MQGWRRGTKHDDPVITGCQAAGTHCATHGEGTKQICADQGQSVGTDSSKKMHNIS